jgi:hypothetical protein
MFHATESWSFVGCSVTQSSPCFGYSKAPSECCRSSLCFLSVIHCSRRCSQFRTVSWFRNSISNLFRKLGIFLGTAYCKCHDLSRVKWLFVYKQQSRFNHRSANHSLHLSSLAIYFIVDKCTVLSQKRNWCLSSRWLRLQSSLRLSECFRSFPEFQLTF